MLNNNSIMIDTNQTNEGACYHVTATWIVRIKGKCLEYKAIVR